MTKRAMSIGTRGLAVLANDRQRTTNSTTAHTSATRLTPVSPRKL